MASRGPPAPQTNHHESASAMRSHHSPPREVVGRTRHHRAKRRKGKVEETKKTPTSSPWTPLPFPGGMTPEARRQSAEGVGNDLTEGQAAPEGKINPSVYEAAKEHIHLRPPTPPTPCTNTGLYPLKLSLMMHFNHLRFASHQFLMQQRSRWNPWKRMTPPILRMR